MEAEQVPPAGMRENMLETAVKFLQNPKVRQSPFVQRRTFLEKKGLTKEEIDEAIARSGTAGDEHAVLAPTEQRAAQAVQPQLPVMVAPPVSPWSRAIDYAATVIVVGGLGYALYQFFKRYVAPIWFGPSREEKQLLSIEDSVKSLQDSMAQTLKSIEGMQETLGKQQENITKLFSDGMAQRGHGEMNKMQDRQYVTEIKEEIKSLKGLLLNRKQFPPTPKTTPVIPAWQLEASKSSQSPADNTTPASQEGDGSPPDAASSSSLPATDSVVTTSLTASSSNTNLTDGEPTVGVEKMSSTETDPAVNSQPDEDLQGSAHISTEQDS